MCNPKLILIKSFCLFSGLMGSASWPCWLLKTLFALLGQCTDSLGLACGQVQKTLHTVLMNPTVPLLYRLLTRGLLGDPFHWPQIYYPPPHVRSLHRTSKFSYIREQAIRNGAGVSRNPEHFDKIQNFTSAEDPAGRDCTGGHP